MGGPGYCRRRAVAGDSVDSDGDAGVGITHLFLHLWRVNMGDLPTVGPGSLQGVGRMPRLTVSEANEHNIQWLP
jgi:hypothetical protein